MEDWLLAVEGGCTVAVLIHRPLLSRRQLPAGLVQLLPGQLPRMGKLLLLSGKLLVKLLCLALPQAGPQVGSWLHAGWWEPAVWLPLHSHGIHYFQNTRGNLVDCCLMHLDT